MIRDLAAEPTSRLGEELVHTRSVARSRVAVFLAMGLAMGGCCTLAPAAFAGAQDAVRDAQIGVRVKTALINDAVLSHRAGTGPPDLAAGAAGAHGRGPEPQPRG
jgi:hypothetical protein